MGSGIVGVGVTVGEDSVESGTVWKDFREGQVTISVGVVVLFIPALTSMVD